MINIYILINKKFNLFIIFLFLLAMHLVIKPSDGDDLYFIQASKESSLIDFLHMRYVTWSGRLFPDTVAFLVFANYFWLWKIINPLMIFLLAYSIGRIIKKEVQIFDILMIACLIFCFNKDILAYAIFWTTGSLNYLWAVSTAIFSMIPLADLIFRNDKSIKYYILYVCAALVSAFSNEQVGLCVIGFSIVAYMILIYKKNYPSIKHILLTVISIIGITTVLLAPGNPIRFDAEVINWFPTFKDLSLMQHIEVGVTWTYDMLFNAMKHLILFISFLLLLINYQKPRKKLFYIFTAFFCFSICTLLLSDYVYRLFFTFTPLLDVYIGNNLREYLKFCLAIFPYLYWSLFFILLLCMVIKNSKWMFRLLLMLAALCSLIVMWFSPTIYASGFRTLFVSSTLLAIFIVNLLMNNRNLVTPLFIMGILPFSIMNIVNMVLYFLDKYI